MLNKNVIVAPCDEAIRMGFFSLNDAYSAPNPKLRLTNVAAAKIVIPIDVNASSCNALCGVTCITCHGMTDGTFLVNIFGIFEMNAMTNPKMTKKKSVNKNFIQYTFCAEIGVLRIVQ